MPRVRREDGTYGHADLTGRQFGELTVHKQAGFVDTSWARLTLWECKCSCGNTSIVRSSNLSGGHTRSCGHLRDYYRKHGQRGANGPRWKGGRVLHKKSGYAYLHRPEHPHANKMGYVAEHRVVMEECMHRYLSPKETVHHKNGIKDDNRPDNLELRVGNHGKHQSVVDLVTWAMEILDQHKDTAFNLLVSGQPNNIAVLHREPYENWPIDNTPAPC